MVNMKTVHIFLVCFLVFEVVFASENTIRIDLYRRKTPIEQQLKVLGLVRKFGKSILHWFDEKLEHTNETNPSDLYTYLNDNEYYGKVSIGEPPQVFNLAFDTAWSYSWVMSTKCSWSTFGCYFHNKYDHDKSSGYTKDGRLFSENIGDYNLTGFFSYDNFTLGNSKAKNQSFVEMTYVPKSFATLKVDGVLGLGVKTGGYDPFFYTLLKQNKIKDPIFSIYFNRDLQSSAGGSIMLGFIDKKYIRHSMINNKMVYDSITYLPIDKFSYWQFNIDAIRVNPYMSLCSKGCKGIVDTSTNTITGPKDKIKKLLGIMGATKNILGQYTVDCKNLDKLPTIGFVLGGKNFLINATNYITKVSYQFWTFCVPVFVEAETPNEQGRWILGSAFLSEYYSIYNVENKTIGFVPASQ